MVIMKIKRFYGDLSKWVKEGKVLAIFGPRRVGKTTLLTDYLKECGLKYRLDSGDNIGVGEVFSSQDPRKITGYAEGYDLIALDEAQRIRGVGLGLKILVDHAVSTRVIATGSSSFELAGQIGEPLTGRKTTITLFPVAQCELAGMYNRQELRERLESFLVYGSYPEALIARSDIERRRVLEEIANSYLLKDILELDRVKNPKALNDLLRLVAFQIGNEVSLSELAAQVGLDRNTVSRYLDLLEKSFVLYNVRGYSRNLRKEVTKKSKYYFYDTGIRNAVIANFNDIPLRNDVGPMWENFLMIERLKMRSYKELWANPYFWRTWEKHEIDLVEERGGKLFGYEFKWGNRKPREPRLWRETYPEASYEIITPENYLDFVL